MNNKITLTITYPTKNNQITNLFHTNHKISLINTPTLIHIKRHPLTFTLTLKNYTFNLKSLCVNQKTVISFSNVLLNFDLNRIVKRVVEERFDVVVFVDREKGVFEVYGRLGGVRLVVYEIVEGVFMNGMRWGELEKENGFLEGEFRRGVLEGEIKRELLEEEEKDFNRGVLEEKEEKDFNRELLEEDFNRGVFEEKESVEFISDSKEDTNKQNEQNEQNHIHNHNFLNQFNTHPNPTPIYYASRLLPTKYLYKNTTTFKPKIKYYKTLHLDTLKLTYTLLHNKDELEDVLTRNNLFIQIKEQKGFKEQTEVEIYFLKEKQNNSNLNNLMRLFESIYKISCERVEIRTARTLTVINNKMLVLVDKHSVYELFSEMNYLNTNCCLNMVLEQSLVDFLCGKKNGKINRIVKETGVRIQIECDLRNESKESNREGREGREGREDFNREDFNKEYKERDFNKEYKEKDFDRQYCNKDSNREYFSNSEYKEKDFNNDFNRQYNQKDANQKDYPSKQFHKNNTYSYKLITISANNIKSLSTALHLILLEYPSTLTFFLPEKHHKRIIGFGGRNIQRIMKKHGVYIKFYSAWEKNKRDGNVVIKTPKKNKNALILMKREILSLIDEQQIESMRVKMCIFDFFRFSFRNVVEIGWEYVELEGVFDGLNVVDGVLVPVYKENEDGLSERVRLKDGIVFYRSYFKKDKKNCLNTENKENENFLRVFPARLYVVEKRVGWRCVGREKRGTNQR